MRGKNRDIPAAGETRIAAETPRQGPEAGVGDSRAGRDPILGLRGLGRDIWADEEADAYVRRLREGWR